jgi:hypothetical protein
VRTTDFCAKLTVCSLSFTKDPLPRRLLSFWQSTSSRLSQVLSFARPALCQQALRGRGKQSVANGFSTAAC